MKQASIWGYIQTPEPEKMVPTTTKLSTVGISPIGNVITLEELIDWDNS